MIRLRFLLPLWLLCVLMAGCGRPSQSTSVSRPAFSSDSAYLYISQQVEMGPRVPDTRAHTECLIYLMQQLERMGAVVECQHGTMLNYSGQEQMIVNIIGHFGAPVEQGRLLLAAHYDSRPWCDEEDDYDQRFMPVPGANDGASGVGVLLEVARQLGLQQQDSSARVRPVDIVFFDCEDMGTPSFYTGTQREDTWCLGSQFWAEALKANGQERYYQFGILLDMVGAEDAVFCKEYYSMQFASDYVEKMWRTAGRLGHGRYFSHERIYPITDDHFYVNSIASIPMLDIVHYGANGRTGFPAWWHTQQDNMTHISRATLQAVGETVMATIQ